MRTSLSILLVFLLAACSPGREKPQSTQSPAAAEQPPTVPVKNDFREVHRPQFHFTPPAQWMNDPNGMVYHKGEYHLFYQHYPDSTVWGPMHWGHAVSKDLMHWQHLPVALYPDSLGYIFSGSAVVDRQNTSGFGSAANPPLVAVYTYHFMPGEKAGRNDYQTQGIAYSLDNGRTWKKHANNPVIKNPGIRDFRDPKVFWHEASRQWVMILAVLDHVALYGSPNLKDWRKLSEFGKGTGSHGGVWECPDFFPLRVEGTTTRKWVMLVSLSDGNPNGGSGTQYFVGEFDGKEFRNDNRPGTVLWLDYGRDNYAGVTWSDLPPEDGRRIFLGWMSNWKYANAVPTAVWRSAMTVPREMTLRNTVAGMRVRSVPVKELQALRQATKTIEAREITGSYDVSQAYGLHTALAELDLNFDVARCRTLTVKFSNDRGESVVVGYSTGEKQLFIDRTAAGKTDFRAGFSGRHVAPLPIEDGQLNLRILLDVSSVEVFANGGQAVMTDLFFPNGDFTKIEINSTGSATLKESRIYPLKSIWDPVGPGDFAGGGE